MVSETYSGVYPTMITPYDQNGEIDYEAVQNLVEWYIEKGCSGIFAVCQSSEMAYLTLKERITLSSKVVEYVNGRIKVVASGHCGYSIKEQIHEINEISKTGIDAFVLVSNRFDINDEGDDVWIANAEKVLEGLDIKIPLGIYECPLPYKRLLTDKILKWCIKKGNFRFVKDTCCDLDILKERLELLADSEIRLFNANAQTLLPSLRSGAAGYSGVMANFHPEIYNWLCNNMYDKRAEIVQGYLAYVAFSESMSYPITAKYHMNLLGIPMELSSRVKKKSELTKYEMDIIRQGIITDNAFCDMLELSNVIPE